MSSTLAIGRHATGREIPFAFRHHFATTTQPRSVVVVSADSEIRAAMGYIIRGCALTSVPANGFAELKSAYSESAPIACLCGFDLADGSFLDVVRFLEEQSIRIPVIMISPRSAGESPACFLDSIRAGALATICYPYRFTDVQLVLWSVIQYQHESRQVAEPAEPAHTQSPSASLR
jgi:DNA-binding NtrC family response regulator